jgi:acetylglutamate kinase
MSHSNFFNALIRHKEKYERETIVIKFGGELAKNESFLRSCGEQVSFLTSSIKANVIVVHGGGIQIDDLLKKEGIEPARDPVTSLRITDSQTLDVSDRALSTLGSHIVRSFMRASTDVSFISMAGYNARAITALPISHFTGEANIIHKQLFEQLFALDTQRTVPVIHPICWNEAASGEENRLNVNADHVAATIASHLGAKRLIMCTDVPGILDKEGKVIQGIATDKAEELILNGTVTGGMKPKLLAAVHAAERLPHGGVVILDGREDESILSELLTDDGIGTLIRRPEQITDFSNPGYEPAI